LFGQNVTERNVGILPQFARHIPEGRDFTAPSRADQPAVTGSRKPVPAAAPRPTLRNPVAPMDESGARSRSDQSERSVSRKYRPKKEFGGRVVVNGDGKRASERPCPGILWASARSPSPFVTTPDLAPVTRGLQSISPLRRSYRIL